MALKKMRVAGVSLGALCAGSLALLSSGCAKEEIRTYNVPKTAPEGMQTAAGMATVGPKPHLHYEAPSNWAEKPPEGMRAAIFTVHSPDGGHAEVTVTPLPGADDIELPSINMWRSELRLEPLNAGELAAAQASVTVGEHEGHLFEFESGATNNVSTNGVKAPGRTLGAIVNAEGASWFFKMTGDNALVAKQRDAFKAFLASVEFHGADAHGTPTAQAAPVEDEQGAALPEWAIPAHWRREAPGQMVMAAFRATNNAGEANVTVASFPGDVGGLVANIDRWRRQIGLPAIEPSEVKSATTTVGEGVAQATVVDFTGPNGRLIAGIAKVNGQSWFYKITGPTTAVEPEKEHFLKFIQSAKYPNAG